MKHTMNTKSKDKHMARIPSAELVTAQHDLSNGAYKLLMYYYSKGDTWDWREDIMCTDLSISSRMLREYKSELTKKDYLYIVKGGIDNYFIGRQAVMDWKYPEEDTRELNWSKNDKDI